MAPLKTMKRHFGGAAKKYLEANFPLPADKNPDCFLNGHVYLLFIGNGSSPTKTVKQIRELYGLELTTGRVIGLVHKSRNCSRNLSRPVDRKRFEDICKTPYVCTISARPSKKTLLQESQENQLLVLPESEPTSVATVELSSADVICSNTSENLPRSSREKLTSREIQLKKRLSFLSAQIASSTIKHREKIAVLKAKLKDMPTKIKVLKQKVKRKSITIKALKKKIHLVQKDRPLKISLLNKKVKRKTSTIKALRNKIHELQKNEKRKNIKSFKVKKDSSDWKIKNSDQINSNVIVITGTNTNFEKNNNLDEEHLPHMNEEKYTD